MSIDTVREARDAAWEKCRKEREPYEGSDEWTTVEACTYQGFFNLGYTEALSTIDPEAIRRECADRAKKWLVDMLSDMKGELDPRYRKLREEAITSLTEAILEAEPEGNDNE